MPSINSATNKAIVAYVPALHAGYLAFLSKHKDQDIFVLGKSVLRKFERLERDIRALQSSEVVQALLALFPTRRIFLLEKRDVSRLRAYKNLLLPDEDVSRWFVGEYLDKKSIVRFESVFLRWDKFISAQELVVDPDRVVSKRNHDRQFLKKAVIASEKSADWWRRIGAVAVKNRRIVLTAYNRHLPSNFRLDIFGDPRSNVDAGERSDLYTSIHAEADIIAQAARTGTALKGSYIFVTTFPCSNCARLLARAEVKRVYYKDGYSRLDAEEILKSAGIEIILVK
jgi:dCMP deaminase